MKYRWYLIFGAILITVIVGGCISDINQKITFDKETPYNETELLSCNSHDDCALAVEKDACCVCPKLRNKEYIEANSNIDFYFKWNYTSPEKCENYDVSCSPCLYLDTFTCYNNTCEWLYLKDEWRTCEQDSDCIETQTDICSCWAGGGQTGINRNYFYNWHDRLDDSGGPEDVCLDVVKCQYGRTKCIENKCEFITLNNTSNITRGIYGYTTLLEGNCMPITNKLRCEETHISREIYVKNKEGMLIASTTSDENGFYEIQLPPSNYSVFIDDNGSEYCNRISGGEIEKCPVEIEYANHVKKYDIQIDHASH